MSSSEAVAEASVDPAFWRDRRVLLTGHTGFKGAWLSLWLQLMGAHVTGFSSGVPTEPSLYELASVGDGLDSVWADVRDRDALGEVVERTSPEVVIHMAAQSLVRRSFADPVQTYATNVMGTVNLLDAIRLRGAGVRAMVNVTSDKCYENHGAERGYREHDPMGGHDPYSSSKGCAELVTQAFRRSFFSAPEQPRLASARAGNVIGGGDWGQDRLLPDVMRALRTGETLHVRNPNAVRPWQHVLNPLGGYLVLAQALWSSADHARAWNFGPVDRDARPVGEIVERMCELCPQLSWQVDDGPHPHEASYLKLDSSLAGTGLGWRPRVGLDDALLSIAEWHRALGKGADMRALTLSQIQTLQRTV